MCVCVRLCVCVCACVCVCVCSLVWDGLQWVGDVHVGDGLVQSGVTDGYQVSHNVSGQDGVEMRGHALPEVVQEVLNLHKQAPSQ